MVLQADPTEAIIWGFLEGNSNQVSIEGTCHFKEKEINVFKNAQNLEVNHFYNVLLCPWVLQDNLATSCNSLLLSLLTGILVENINFKLYFNILGGGYV